MQVQQISNAYPHNASAYPHNSMNNMHITFDHDRIERNHKYKQPCNAVLQTQVHSMSRINCCNKHVQITIKQKQYTQSRGLLESSKQMPPSRKVRLGAACNNPHADPALGGYEPPIRRNRRSTPRAVLSPLPHQLAMLLPTLTEEREVNKQAVTPEQQEQASQVNAPKTANEDGENPGPIIVH
jgi:hypothetical protein